MVIASALLNSRNVVENHSSLAASVFRFLDVSLQNESKYFLMGVLDHVRAEGAVLLASPSEHCSVVECMTRERHEDIRRAITKGLDVAWSLPEVAVHDHSGICGSLGTGGNDGVSRHGVRLFASPILFVD